MDIITTLLLVFVAAPVVFLVLFIIFLIRSVKLGKRIRELEKEINTLRYGNDAQQIPAAPAPVMMPQPVFFPGMQPEYIRLPEIQPQGFVPDQSARFQNGIPGQAPAPVLTQTPEWAVPPSQAENVHIPVVTAEPAPRKKVFSSINITFGIGVLLLTIVGATFMTGSWPWMTEEFRAGALVAIVVMIYGMSFLAGKILKLQQTEFALYSLASLLGPIVIVGMGAFNLLGSAFSFKNGSGWLVVTVAAAALVVSSVGGRFLFREEKNQANIYQATFYISITWLVVFLSAQIGHASEVVNEWSMICLGLATMALVFRLMALTDLMKGEVFFKVYSEITTYIPAVFLGFTLFFSDGAVFGATIVEFAAFVLLARFTEGRQWVRYLTPLTGMMIAVSWLVFGGTDDMYQTTSVFMTIIFILFVVHKITGISTWVSDIGLPVLLGSITSFIAVEEVPVMGAAACFLTLILLLIRMIAEPRIAGTDFALNKLFSEKMPVPVQIVLSVLSAVFYYGGMIMVFLSADHWPFKGHLFMTLSALVPVLAAIVTRIVWKDDLKIRVAGAVLSVIAVVSGLLSCFSYEGGNTWYEHIGICSGLLTLAVISMAVLFIIRPLKEKRLSVFAMFWMSLCLNSFAIAVFMIIDFTDLNMRVKGIPDIPGEMAFKIAALSFTVLNIAALAAVYFIKRKGKELIAAYAAGLKYFFNGFTLSWFLLTWLLAGSNWEFLIVSVVVAVLLSVLDSEFFAVLPVITAEICLILEYAELENRDLNNVLCIASALVFAAAGRLIFRKKIITGKAVDYLSLTPVAFLFGLYEEDYVPLMVFLTLALLVINLAGRVKIPVRVLASVFASLICAAVIAQPFIFYPDVIELEINLIIMLGTLLLICKVIRPAPGKIMKYIWFTGVALCIVAEGISAAVTKEALDLIVVGTASFGIFIYAFIRRNRLWFILGVVSMISIAIYLSLAFWSSLVWLIYLLSAGVILVAMAAVNEWGKRHSKDGKTRRFFDEWTW